MYIYGLKNKIQRLISPVLLNEIQRNLVSTEVQWVLTPKNILVQFAPPEPPFFNTWKNLHLGDIVSWQPHLGLVLWNEFCLVYFLFFGLPCGLARPLIYTYIGKYAIYHKIYKVPEPGYFKRHRWQIWLLFIFFLILIIKKGGSNIIRLFNYPIVKLWDFARNAKF